MPVRGGETETVRCPAKLNLFLEVHSKRPDGYHDIDSVMVEAPLADRLEVVESSEGGASLEVVHAEGWRGEPVPGDESNLALRAALLLLHEAGSARGVHLRLTKNVPPEAGLGGGSSDAAAALRVVNRLLGGPVRMARLATLAASLGSDVPYFLVGGAARARGKGERVEAVPCPNPIRFTVFTPDLPVATPEVYALCRPPEPADRRDPAPVLDALRAGDAAALALACFNRLEEPAREVCPALAEAIDAARAAGIGPVHMSGSGSAFFLVRDPGGPPDAEVEGVLLGLPCGGSVATG